MENKLIEKQIEEAAHAIALADDWARRANLVKAHHAMSAACSLLLQVVQNQQAKIEFLNKQCFERSRRLD